MKIVIVADPESYAAMERGEMTHLYGSVHQVEVRQADGLLTQTFRCAYVDKLGSEVASSLGLPDGKPAITIWLAPEKQEEAPCLQPVRQMPARR